MSHTTSDSAGQPWAGRHFDQNSFSGDDGKAPPHLLEAVEGFRRGEVGEADVVDAIRTSRLLIPLVARLDEAGTDERGRTFGTSAELAIVTVAGPDGRNVLPAFSSVETMQRWNPTARPVPADAVRVTLAAASEHTDLVVLDPASPGEFVIRRPALWSIGRSERWIPSYLDDEVIAAFETSAGSEESVVAVRLGSGDPDARLAGPEIAVELAIMAGLDRQAVNAVLARLQVVWAADEVIATRVDSLGVTLVVAS
jgi:hypothetical protein